MIKYISDWSYRFILKNKYGFSSQEIAYFKRINRGTLAGLEEKYISQKKFDSFRCKMESRGWKAIVHNKWITAKYFESYFIDQPQYFGLLQFPGGRASDGKRLASADDLEALVKEKNLKNFVLKHIGGGMGSHVYIIDDVEQVNGQLIFTTIDNKRLVKEDIADLIELRLGNLKGFIVQERLQIHPLLNDITEGGLVSVRIYTLSNKQGISKPKAAFIRFGTKGKATDHSHNDGVYALVDLETGTIKKGICISAEHDWKSTHPVTNKLFQSLKVPYWNSLIELAVKASDSCFGLKWVGWDIIVTEDGPRLIEGNIGDNDFKSAQLLFGGFIDNGIFDSWMNELNLPDKDKNDYNSLSEWKKNYAKELIRGR